MPVHLLEINDLGVSLSDGSERVESPGYALLDGASLMMGEAARAQARIKPRQVQSQFWSRLGTDPLPNASGKARHNADLAWAHLTELHQQSGQPDELVIAVPASMSREQLGMLLGITQRCAFSTVGLVDSAIAAAAGSGQSNACVHLDLQLHQCVLTQVGVDHHELLREQVEVIPATGWLNLMERWAAMITAGFVKQCRFDPLHAAQSEQQLFDRVPGWLAALASEPDIEAELNSGGATYRASFSRDDFASAAKPVLTQLESSLNKLTHDGSVLLSHRLAHLPGINQLGRRLCIAEHSAVYLGCALNIDRIRSSDGSVRFIHRLPVSITQHADNATDAAVFLPESAVSPPETSVSVDPAKAAAQPSTDAAPTHVLSGAKAWRLGSSPAWLRRQDTRWMLSTGTQDSALASLERIEGRVIINPTAMSLTLNGRRIEHPTEVIGGDRIGLADSDVSELRLITESPLDGA